MYCIVLNMTIRVRVNSHCIWLIPTPRCMQLFFWANRKWSFRQSDSLHIYNNRKVSKYLLKVKRHCFNSIEFNSNPPTPPPIPPFLCSSYIIYDKLGKVRWGCTWAKGWVSLHGLVGVILKHYKEDNNCASSFERDVSPLQVILQHFNRLILW